jgi:hypothetical protein
VDRPYLAVAARGRNFSTVPSRPDESSVAAIGAEMQLIALKKKLEQEK